MSANATSNAQLVYVYGVVPAGTALSLQTRGVAGRPLELLERDDVAAVVSEFPAGDFRVRRSDLQAHLRAVEEIFALATVAPCPFGTVLASRADVASQFLDARADELRELLERLEGHVQMNVRAEYDEEAVLREVVESDREIARLRARTTAMGDAAYYENIRFGELIASRLAERRAADAAAIEERLTAAAAASVYEEGRGELVVFKGSFLVARDGLPTFDAVLDEVAAKRSQLLRFEVTGPLPPVAFATLEPGVEAWV
jgi:hypothetical protein